MSENTIDTEDILNQNNNEDMYNYLVDKLEGTGATIEVLDNGGIWVSNWEAGGAYKNQLYIPPNLDSNNVSMISYLPGSGGFVNDAQPLRNKIMSETPPDCIITLAQGCDDQGNTMEAAAAICADNGLEITNLTVQTFSASGGVGFQKLETYLDNHPNVNATMIVADGYNMSQYGIYMKDIDTIAERGVPVVLVNPSNNGRLSSEIKFLDSQGINLYVIGSNRGGHVDINKDIINNGMLEYSLGIADEFGGPNNNLDKCNYILYRYDPDNPNADRLGYVAIEGFEEIRQENEAYGYTLERLNYNPFDDGSVGSDMYGVVTSLNSIRQSMGGADVATPTYTSTSTIPGNLMNAESSLIGISNDLNGTIYKETQVISSIAQVFYDMDRERTNAAAALSDGRELLFDESAYTDVLNQLISVDITSNITFENFRFDPFSHAEGNSGKICLSDLNSMISGTSLVGPLHENLENERQSAKATLTEIDNLNTMISTGANFKGDIWKAVGTRLTEYSGLMDLRIESADKLEEAMVKAIKLIVDYMGEYEELDDAKLPELKEKAEQIKQNILDAENIINATHNVPVPVEDENAPTTYRYITQYVYSAGARNDAKNYIYQARKLLIEINKEINKLENLPIVLAQAEQIVNDALVEIYGNYGVKVSNTVTGKTVSYIPPQNTNYVAPPYSRVDYFLNTRVIEGKVDQGRFYMTPALQAQYGSYEDYLNNVLKENNPMYNHELEDNGIEPGQSLDDKIFDKPEEPEEPEVPEETPETGDDVGDTPEEPQTPSNPKPDNTNPQTPSNPKPEGTTPETPSDPKPEDTTPETPSDPKPEGTTPETPSDPKPEDTTPETPSDPKPEDTTPETPSDPKPEDTTPVVPEEPKPEIPSNPEPEKPSEPKPEKPSTKPNVDEKPSSPVIPNVPGTDDTPGVTPDIPSEPDIDIPPIVEIPDDDFITPDIPAVDDTPVIDDKPIDITPPNVKDEPSGNDNGIDLAKAIGISLGAGAAVGAAALGAHTVKKAKDNNIYEDE